MPATVYPRACGGTVGPVRTAPLDEGLSPRLRGNLDGMLGVPLFHGSIPAPAGEPQGVPVVRATLSVYPRACGGTISSVFSQLTICGLSPRLRGNQPRPKLTGERPRSIPAPAGEPTLERGASTRTAVYPRACGGTGHVPHEPRHLEGLSPRLRGNRDPLP